MKTWHRFTMTAVACAAGLTLACSGKTTGDGGGGTGNACDDYFQIAFSGLCASGPLPPASEVTRIQGRFDTLCADALALPGAGITASTLESCVAAIKSGGCAVADQENGPCSFTTGSLAAGSSCVTEAQCQSGTCTAGNEAPDGGTLLCGTCATPVAIGQSCANGQGCGPNAVCNYGTGTSSPTCAAITFGTAGAPCNESTTQCSAGLVCDVMTQKCAAPGGAGAACDSDQACIAPLVCPPAASGASTCQSPVAAGAACTDDADCASGLGCTQTTHQCAAVTWVSAGQPCSDTARCLVGGCPSTGSTVGGTCPTVIADGQPCNESDSTTSTCDTFANCEGGTCVLGYAACP
jgi:hypothetical protein